MFSPTLDTADVAAFLAQELGPVADVEPLAAGEWSRAFAFRQGGEALVARFGRYPEDYAKDAIAAGFAGPDLPVPQIRRRGEAFGGVYAIAPRAYGAGFDDLSEAEYRRALPALFRALAAIRRIDLSGTSGYGLWSPRERAPYDSWRELLLDAGRERKAARGYGALDKLATVPGALDTYETAHRLLEEQIGAATEERALIHADFMGENVLVDGERVAAVLDWGNAMYGDFLYDLARWTFFTPWVPELAKLDLRALAREHYEANGVAIPDFAARLRLCEIHLGMDAQAYHAYSERWDDLARSGPRTLEVARGGE